MLVPHVKHPIHFVKGLVIRKGSIQPKTDNGARSNPLTGQLLSNCPTPACMESELEKETKKKTEEEEKKNKETEEKK